MSHSGLEPETNWLKAKYSTIELVTRYEIYNSLIYIYLILFNILLMK